MGNLIRTRLPSAALAVALFAAPAVSGPVPAQNAGRGEAASSNMLSVRDGPRYRDRTDWQQPYGWGRDTVGSLGYDGHYYAYNRFSGQRYRSCVEDLGYGRVGPCDAGRR